MRRTGDRETERVRRTRAMALGLSVAFAAGGAVADAMGAPVDDAHVLPRMRLAAVQAPASPVPLSREFRADLRELLRLSVNSGFGLPSNS